MLSSPVSLIFLSVLLSCALAGSASTAATATAIHEYLIVPAFPVNEFPGFEFPGFGCKPRATCYLVIAVPGSAIDKASPEVWTVVMTKLTTAQIEAFRRDGFLAPVALASADEARGWRDDLEAFERTLPEARN